MIMKNKIPCEVIQDLFPLYIDELTSDVTNKEIEEHVTECSTCKSVLDSMKYPTGEKNESDAIEKKEIDFLKKTKQKNRKAMLGGIVGVVVLAIATFFAYRYLIGFSFKIDPDEWKVSVYGNEFEISGLPSDNRLYVNSINVEENDGIVHFDNNCAYTFDKDKEAKVFTYDTDSEIKEIWNGDDIIWSNGTRISKRVSAVYATKHLYMGDMPANSSTANALGLTEKFGNYTSELQSSKEEPLRWQLNLEKTFSEDEAAAYAYVLLAVIENLDEVEFKCMRANSDGSIIDKIYKKEDIMTNVPTVTCVTNIKDAGEDIATLQQLFIELGLEKNNLQMFDSANIK